MAAVELLECHLVEVCGMARVLAAIAFMQLLVMKVRDAIVLIIKENLKAL